MIYETTGGEKIDTARQCSFDERNLLQKMMIHQHLGLDRRAFREKWLAAADELWGGPPDMGNPSAAVRVLLDMERGLAP